MVHVLHPKIENDLPFFQKGKNTYLLGRCQDCDIKISDISVSRNHCQIHFKDKKFWLQDTLSKFGTLTLAQGKVQVLPGTQLGMQIGRNLLIFQLVENKHDQMKAGQHMKHLDKEGKKKNDEERKAFKEKKNEEKKNGKRDVKVDGFEIAQLDFNEYLYEMENHG